MLLAKWFKGIIDLIEAEFQKSALQREQVSKHGTKKVFSTQRVHENEISKTDSYLLIQIAHNIAIKEITRQVSVQCIERGILLKTIFDSYVRMIDLVFIDSIIQRRSLTKTFATVCERQVSAQNEEIEQKARIIEEKDRQIEQLMLALDAAHQKKLALMTTNKKLTTMAMRA